MRAGQLLLVCLIDGFDQAINVDGVPIDAAAPFWPRLPKYFHATIDFAGERFTNVGIRYKGNNGLASSRGEKRPLRLKIDQWEKDDATITDQRLFGFQHLSLSPNATDPSNLHQVLAAEVFRDNGVPAPLSGYAEVTLDTGDGPRLIGLYALTETPDDPLLNRVFGSDEGNLYKPDGRGAHFVSFIRGSIHKQNNDDDTALADVRSFVGALHADQSDRAQWRQNLQARFDIEGFADFFAVNQLIGNWDTYGGLAHNFYLYSDPAKAGQLRFIAWDFDLSFDGTGQANPSPAVYSGDWPLLQAIARDPELSRRYHERLATVLDEELDSGVLSARVDVLVDLISPAIEREIAANAGDDDEVSPRDLERFETGVAILRGHLELQKTEIGAYLRRIGLR